MTAPSQPAPAGTPRLSMPRNATPPPGAAPESTPAPGTSPPGTPPARWRLPRRTVRLKLTLLYGGLFLASGAALLAVTYVLVEHRLPVAISTQGQVTGGGSVKEFCAFNGTGSGGTATLPVGGCSSLVATLNAQRSTELNQLLEES